MTLLLLLCGCGLLSGFLLMNSVPRCRRTDHPAGRTQFSIIIPARNEEENLPKLLASIAAASSSCELIVVDDNSTDRTPRIAEAFGARVVHPGEPPRGFKGKAWACARGAAESSTDLLFFLDADTWFEPNGLENILQTFAGLPSSTALSVLPFAVTKRAYEELSLFFNLMMAFGAGGFGIFQSPRLFGQSLILTNELYRAIGGHDSVGEFVLENFHLAQQLKDAHGRSVCLAGRGSLHMRMFPNGLKQLSEGWTKAFADGAQSTDSRVLFVSVLWLTSLAATAAVLPFSSASHLHAALTLYIFAAIQIFFLSRQIGSFRIATCLLFPLPLTFFFIIFSRSAIRRATRRPTNWRGRNV